MRKLAIACLVLATLPACGVAPQPAAPRRPAAMQALKKPAQGVAITLKVLGEKGNGYTTAYRLTAETKATKVVYDFDDTPLQDEPGGPYRTAFVKLTVDGKAVSMNDVKAVEAAAKLFEDAAEEVDERHRKAVQTAVRALTWDL